MMRATQWIRPLVLAALAVCLLADGVRADPVFVGGTGAISFGVSPYGPPTPGVPTYIPNNLTGRQDILSSPGGTFLTANPVVANNIREVGPFGLPMYGFQFGGGNANGPFGGGAIAITGPRVGFNLFDPLAGGGSASYGIASWSATFTDPVGYNGGFGTYLAVAGQVFNQGAAAVASLRTYITSNNPQSPFFGGLDLPQLVLAASHNPGDVASFVALGGSGAAMLIAPNWTFQGLAINNFNVAIPAGDIFTAVTTLTIYADPSALYAIEPDAALIAATGATLPDFGVVTMVPEPGSVALLGLGGLILTARFLRRRSATA